MRFGPLVLVLVAGCSFSGHGMPDDASLIDARVIDAAIDDAIDGSIVVVDAPDGGPIDAPPDVSTIVCYGSGNFMPCFPTRPTQDLSLDDETFDTDACNASDASTTTIGGVSVCVRAGRAVSVTGNFDTTGTRPLVIVADTSLTVEASAKIHADAGRIFAACVDGDGIPSSSAGSGGGGGAGGSFRGVGGFGGNTGGANGGMPQGALLADTLHGGCRGGLGGKGLVGSSSGERGNAGGALLLIAGGAMAIDGVIEAGGGRGGGGKDPRAGGGGGGAGGMIVLHAGTLVVATGAKIVANGGSGGGGANQSSSGQDGTSGTTWDAAALPGAGASPGGVDGGAGGFLATAATNGQLSSANGAGGGGGGVGAIRILAGGIPTGRPISPTPTN